MLNRDRSGHPVKLASPWRTWMLYAGSRLPRLMIGAEVLDSWWDDDRAKVCVVKGVTPLAERISGTSHIAWAETWWEHGDLARRALIAVVPSRDGEAMISAPSARTLRNVLAKVELADARPPG